CAALDDPESIVRALYYRLTKRFGNRSAIEYITIRLTGEQSPNPSSRVVLTEELDPLGMRRAGLDWRIAQNDYDNLYDTALAFAKGIGATGFGRMRVPSPGEISVMGVLHHMGTTRMHDDRRYGVVDRNCTLHGIKNLFVAGSSIFPTSGRVN